MSNWKLYSGAAAAIMATAAIVAPAEAQVTSSSVNGSVVSETGAPVSGASVTITHEPTGTSSSTTTTNSGAFRASGLRVGGPYTIVVASGETTITRENIFLQASSNSLQIALQEEARTLEAVRVVGTSSQRLDINRGVGSAFTEGDILNQPATERDLVATLVQDPLASSSGEGQLSIAGVNPRFNALAIDGSLQGDDFGLSSSTYATARAPISLDAIESASVAASDYSVKSSGFTGGLVNVVTKSGTNEFDGSLYYYRQDEDYYGNSAFDQFVDRAAFKEEEYGVTLGGPIIKDKLWFFAAYDEFESGSSANFAAADETNEVDPVFYDEINQIVQDTYGFDLGGRPTTVSLPVTSERFLGKVDWQINQDHRASFTYQSTEEGGVSNVGANNFQSAYYATPTELQAYTGQLYSDWTNNLSTELRINFKDYSRGQVCNAGIDVGEFDITLTPDDLVGTPLDGLIGDEVQLLGGCDAFRHGNTFDDERLQILAAANYTWGDHYFTVGGEYENYELDNLFAQRSSGEFRFESTNDGSYNAYDGLVNGVASNISVLLPDTGNREDIRAVWGYNKLSLFAQDSWQIRPDFNLDYGVRLETYVQDDEPQERTFFEDRYGDSNVENLDGNTLIMPRASFEYTPFDRTKITGGFGLFAGGSPQVWVSNAFTPPVFFAELDIEDGDDTSGINPASGLPPALLDMITDFDANDPGPIDIIDPDFETPSDWKASLRLDQRFDMAFGDYFDLGDDYLISLQALYAMTNNGFRWENIAQTEFEAALPTGVAPDGRPIYADLQALGVNNAIQLTNYDDGSSLSLTAALSKQYDNGLGFSASYAFQDTETVTPGTSSRGVSNFRAIIDSDRNNPGAYTSEFQVEHSFKLNLSYEKEIFGDLMSRFNLFGQAYSGEPFSYTFDIGSSNALFGRSGSGESPYDNDLLYVPNISGGSISDASVVLGPDFDEAAFIEYVQARGLDTGSIQDRHDDESTWNQRWDFQYQQELPFFNDFASKYVGENNLKFVVDIKNVANLLNDEWGTQYNGSNFDTVRVVNADLIEAGLDPATAPALTGDAPRTTCVAAGDCVYRFNEFDPDQTSYNSLTRSVYEIRVGIRYEF